MYTGDTQISDYQQIWPEDAVPACKIESPPTATLKALADVFQLADRFTLPDLQNHMCMRFKPVLRTKNVEWMTRDKPKLRGKYLDDVLQHVYQVTHSDDMTLRYEATAFGLEVALKDRLIYPELEKVLV
jgi:hypothetical protein